MSRRKEGGESALGRAMGLIIRIRIEPPLQLFPIELQQRGGKFTIAGP
jgi:hypothetical protein